MKFKLTNGNISISGDLEFETPDQLLESNKAQEAAKVERKKEDTKLVNSNQPGQFFHAPTSHTKRIQ